MVSVVEHEDFVGGLYVPSARHFTDEAGARSPGPESSGLLLGEGWHWATPDWAQTAWQTTSTGRSRVWRREKTRTAPDTWVLMDTREEEATATPWTRLYTTFRSFSSSLLPLQQGSTEKRPAPNVPRIRATMALARTLASVEGLGPAAEALETDDKEGLNKALT